MHTDGWTGYDDLEALGYVHKPLVIDGDPERIEAHLPMIHIAFSNLKSWLLGTHHGVSHRHLQAYLNEFVFRFNRRFYPMTAFNSALGLAAHASAPTYKKTLQRRLDSPGYVIGSDRIGKLMSITPHGRLRQSFILGSHQAAYLRVSFAYKERIFLVLRIFECINDFTFPLKSA